MAEDGLVGQQEFWNGDPLRVLGFQRDLTVNQVDLLWKDAIAEPQRAAGMYLVTTDKGGEISTHTVMVESLAPIDRAGD